MLIESKEIVSITDANQNFSKVVKLCEQEGCVVIFKNNKPKFVLLDIDSNDITLAESGESLQDLSAREIDKDKWL